MSGPVIGAEGLSLSEVRTGKNAPVRDMLCRVFVVVIPAAILLLFLLPDARNGLKALANRLFAASESVNAYAYAYFDVPAGQSITPAVILLSVIAFSASGILLIRRSPLMILGCSTLIAGVQAYFGLSLPGWLNILLFSALGLLLMRGNVPASFWGSSAGVILLSAAVIISSYPGVDPWIETRSEALRDRLTRSVFLPESNSDGNTDDPVETRHVNSRTLLSGEDPSQTDREYRLITKDQEQISLPDWVGDVTSFFPAAAAGAVLITSGYLLLRVDRRRRKAASKRLMFDSANRSEAICAMFRHIADWLESFGYGCGNLPYRDWAENLLPVLPEAYVNRFCGCVPLFEAALYSDKPSGGEQWKQVKDLLDETEALLYQRADFGKRLRLKYWECLYQ